MSGWPLADLLLVLSAHRTQLNGVLLSYAQLAEDQWLCFCACLYTARSVGKTVYSVQGKEDLFCGLLDAVMGSNIGFSQK